MRTAKQIAASRANGKKSRGPRTSVGKAVSCCNALKHGIFALSQLMFDETAEDLADLTAEYHERHAPSSPQEHILVEALIANEWRLRRMRRIETNLWEDANLNVQIKNLVKDFPGPDPCSSGEAFLADSCKFARLQRVVNSCERNYRLARQALSAARASYAPQPEEAKATSESPGSFRTNPKITPQPPADAVKFAVASPEGIQRR